jgi:hypothetical protein
LFYQNNIEIKIYDRETQEKVSDWVITSIQNEFLVSDEVLYRAGNLANYDSLRIYKFGYHVLDVPTYKLTDTLYLQRLSYTSNNVVIQAKQLKKRTLKKTGSVFKPLYKFTPYSSTLLQLSVFPRKQSYLLKTIHFPIRFSSCDINRASLKIVSNKQVLADFSDSLSSDTFTSFNEINVEIEKMKNVEIYYQLDVENPGECEIRFSTVNRGPATTSKIHSGNVIKNPSFPYRLVIME